MHRLYANILFYMREGLEHLWISVFTQGPVPIPCVYLGTALYGHMIFNKGSSEIQLGKEDIFNK